MSVTPEFVKKELVKLEKRKQVNVASQAEMKEALDKANEIALKLQQEEVALRTLAAGPVPKAARPGLAQQLAEILKVKFDEPSIMELIAKYEKQDAVAETTKPTTPARVAKVEEPAETPVAKDQTPPDPTPKKGRGRPKMTDEEKKEAARQRMLAAAEAAAAAKAVEPDAYDDEKDHDEEEYFNPDEYDQE
jgi:hypothetical protein